MGETGSVDLLRTGSRGAAARLWAGLDKPWQEAFRQAWEALRTLGEGPRTDLVHQLEDAGGVKRLAAMEVNEAFGDLWPQLQELTKIMPAS